jgi:histidinol phosphatase-like PHP family hydrolase
MRPGPPAHAGRAVVSGTVPHGMPTNGQIAEVLALAAEGEDGHRRRALERAARSAMFVWTDEAVDLIGSGRSLTELPAVGPWMARRIMDLVEGDVVPPEPPEVRRGFLTLAAARAALATDPGFVAAIRGDLQMHTTETDGKSTLDEMVEGSRARGYAYACITDHSQGLKITNGMDESRLALQGEEIRRLNAAADGPPRVLHGIEMNLSPTGEGDMDPAALAELDLVLGAFHSALRLEEDQTERYLTGVRNPTIDVLAHPTTRRFGMRLGLRADWRAVFEAAADAGHAVEIDGSPARQDLPVELIRIALDTDVLFSIGSDAHHVGELSFLDYGIAAAIVAGVPLERIVNARDVEDLVGWSAPNRRRS